MNANLQIAWAQRFVDGLAASGVEDVVVSPGSRSTPLALAVAGSRLRAHVVADERAAAFFALGQARVTGRPSALVCTSGTAAAHYFPAVIEASQSCLPLVVVTADRPWELADVAASQTIDQTKLFGAFARWFVTLGEPTETSAALASVGRVAAQAVARALAPTPGPVHVNVRLRKPLEPSAAGSLEPQSDAPGALGRAAATAIVGAPSIGAGALDALDARIDGAERILIVAGPAPFSAGADRSEAVLELAERLGAPLLAEATSQLRFVFRPSDNVGVGPIDVVLGSVRARKALVPDLVIALGAPPTSTGFGALADSGVARIVVTPHGWNDPWSSAETLVLAEPAVVARELLGRVRARGAVADAWSAAWRRADSLARAAVEAELGDDRALTEIAIARATIGACPEGTLLVIGNSSPVRDVDVACPPSARRLGVLHQRGAAGIDGLVAGAAGAHAVSDAAVTLLLGDVSFAHDLGGLALAPRLAAHPLVVVVVDNGGGRIFETLPVASRVAHEVFERFFVTPQALDVELAARAFGVAYARASTRPELDHALAAAHARRGTTVVHAIAPPGDAAKRLARIRERFDVLFERGAPS